MEKRQTNPMLKKPVAYLAKLKKSRKKILATFKVPDLKVGKVEPFKPTLWQRIKIFFLRRRLKEFNNMVKRRHQPITKK